jgi:photosystem II stability/assembly factor-like uncharacterized protein
MQLRRTFCLALLGCLSLFFGNAITIAQDSDQPEPVNPKINEGLLGAFSFRNIGPALMSGRICDIAVDPEDTSTWYIAVASGGVWKTTNAGTTWQPIFDNYPSYSIGCITIDPNNHNCIWVGTGENNSQRSVGYGDGVYKSMDGGKSFTQVGLSTSEHIGKIVVHPDNSDVVYVASQGPLWKAGGERGLYKTLDGGKTWKQVLSISENTGISEVVMDPRDPETLYASAYQRRRHQWVLIDGGPESGIHKSTDGGSTWKKINRGLPGGDKGRIGLTISPMQPDVVYAIVEATSGAGGFYRSEDRGETWSRRSSYVSSSPQYYQEIVADPNVMDRVYSLDTYLQVTEDGGRNMSPIGESFKHVDNHALYIDPDDSDHLIIGCDGGLYETFDRGRNYKYFANLPITQFYKIAVDNSEPFYYVYGGTQDNATQGGPSQTDNTHGIRSSDWFITVFGDGFDPAVDPNDPNTVYSQWQYGGLVRYDRKTGERIDIKPRETGDLPALRYHWDSALAISPHDSNRIYYAAQILFRSDDRGDTWEPISEDLTRNLDRNTLKVMGKVWDENAVAKNTSTSFYGCIVSVSESPLVKDLVYVGTDDGMLQVTEDGGASWRAIPTFDSTSVPEFAYISDVEASLHDPDTVYVVAQNFKRGDFSPYVLKSSDRGKSWDLISDDLPERGSAYTIAEDHEQPNLLFVGTEFGVFTTLDGGEKWLELNRGMPTVGVHDLEIQRRENDLVVGSFGRGIYILDNYSALREISPESIEQDAMIFPIKDAAMYIQSNPMGGGSKAYQGAEFYVADNPPFGASISYYLKDSVKSPENEARSKKPKEGYASWEDLKAGDRAESPEMWMFIRNSEGEVVNRLRASTSRGSHRMTWDFRYEGIASFRPGRGGRGPMALPGTYSAQLVQWVDGEYSDVTEPLEFQCVPLRKTEMSEDEQREHFAFQNETAEVQRVMLAASTILSDAEDRVDVIKSMAELSPRVNLDLRKQARELQLTLMDLREQLNGDRTKPARSEPGSPGLMSKLQTVVSGQWAGNSRPTGTQKQQLADVTEALPDFLSSLRSAIDDGLSALEKELDESDAPWSEGRKIPDWPKK